VTPVEGDTMRIDAVLSCARHAGHRLNDKTYGLFYGRRPEPAWVILRRWRYRPQAFGGRLTPLRRWP